MLWIKAVHVLAIISWMAGLLYLPRLMVYHSETAEGGPEDLRFRVMERRLLRAIMTPAAVVAVLTGLWLAWELGLGSRFDADLWFWTKLVAVLGLLAVHGMLAHHVRAFASGLRPHGARYFRVLNEVPTLLMVVIVVMVVVRPY